MFTVLDKVPLEELNSFVNGFFEQLILQKNLNGDTIISDYIEVIFFSHFFSGFLQQPNTIEFFFFFYSVSWKDL